jgi:hypothetical protein
MPGTDGAQALALANAMRAGGAEIYAVSQGIKTNEDYMRSIGKCIPFLRRFLQDNICFLGKVGHIFVGLSAIEPSSRDFANPFRPCVSAAPARSQHSDVGFLPRRCRSRASAHDRQCAGRPLVHFRVDRHRAGALRVFFTRITHAVRLLASPLVCFD